MTERRGWALPESHLLPDAVVAFVDGELSPAAQDRAGAHVTHCPACAGEVTAQRQARAAVESAAPPRMSEGFLANLRSIPEHTEVPSTPDNLAVTEDGQLVAVQRPDRVAHGVADADTSRLPGPVSTSPLGSGPPLGSSTPLGGGNVLDDDRYGTARRRTTQGTGVMVSGIVLSALALVTSSGASGGQAATNPANHPRTSVLPAQLGGQRPPAPVPRVSQPVAPDDDRTDAGVVNRP